MELVTDEYDGSSTLPDQLFGIPVEDLNGVVVHGGHRIAGKVKWITDEMIEVRLEMTFKVAPTLVQVHRLYSDAIEGVWYEV